MPDYLKIPNFWGKKTIIIIIIAGILSWRAVIAFNNLKNERNASDSSFDLSILPESAIIQGNSFASVSNPADPIKPVQTVKMVITAYSSTPWETWGDPFITASGARVEEGIVANNLLPFGTKIRIPELYENKIFVVKDRMHWRKGYYHVDIWFPSYGEALNFGAKKAYIEILEG